jgi:hypothetical protein
MSETLEIRSANVTSVLEITAWQTDDPTRRFDYLDVTLNSTGLRASTRIYNVEYRGDVSTLLAFFLDVAGNWRGWPGEKRWESIESDLKLTCTSTSLGSINVCVELYSHMADPFIWDVRHTLMLESWQLDELAARAEKFFRYE